MSKYVREKGTKCLCLHLWVRLVKKRWARRDCLGPWPCRSQRKREPRKYAWHEELGSYHLRDPGLIKRRLQRLVGAMLISELSIQLASM